MRTTLLFGLFLGAALAAEAPTNPAFGPLAAESSASAVSGPPGDMPMADYLGLLKQIAPRRRVARAPTSRPCACAAAHWATAGSWDATNRTPNAAHCSMPCSSSPRIIKHY